jgi:catechol 2,3-dioxygenase-like lactoylglutathione lyase family enzyme
VTVTFVLHFDEQSMATPPLIGIKETCLYVADTSRTRKFYEGSLGLTCFAEQPGVMVFFRAGTSVLLCFNADTTRGQGDLPAHFGSGELHFAFESDREHYDAWRKTVFDAGIAIEHDHVWKSGHRSFYFRDPDRHCVEIIEAGMWEAQ